ncbi:MAG: hypothetical protein ACK4TL_01430 [Hyphomicrobiaceae bacterium]
MAFVTGDVVPSDDEEHPFKVVFMRGDAIISEWLVDSQEEGEEQILEALRELGASDDDEEDDDEEEDEDEDEDDEENNGKGS